MVAMITHIVYCWSGILEPFWKGVHFYFPLTFNLQLSFIMSSTDTSPKESHREHLLWEQGDSDISTNSSISPLIEATVPSSLTSTHSRMTTSGLNSPMAEITLSSQDSAHFFHLYQLLFYEREEVVLVGGESFAKTGIQGERKFVFHLTILLMFYHQNSNESNTLNHATDILLDTRHHSLLECRRPCSRDPMALSPLQQPYHLVCGFLMSVY